MWICVFSVHFLYRLSSDFGLYSVIGLCGDWSLLDDCPKNSRVRVKITETLFSDFIVKVEYGSLCFVEQFRRQFRRIQIFEFFELPK